jgi:hypothetical protein
VEVNRDGRLPPAAIQPASSNRGELPVELGPAGGQPGRRLVSVLVVVVVVLTRAGSSRRRDSTPARYPVKTTNFLPRCRPGEAHSDATGNEAAAVGAALPLRSALIDSALDVAIGPGIRSCDDVIDAN